MPWLPSVNKAKVFSFAQTMLRLMSVGKHIRPFVLHLLLTIFSVIVAICIIDPRGHRAKWVYNLNQHRPRFTEVDGSDGTGPFSYKPTQSDITTAFSFVASITRGAATWWAGKILWRCAFMFMEKSEITLAGFSDVVEGGITTLLPLRNVLRPRNWLLIYAIIFICFIMEHSSAILTGSVTWQPSFTLVEGNVPLTNLPVGKPGLNISFYREQQFWGLQAIEFASSLSLFSWGDFTTKSSDLSLPSNLTRRAIIQTMENVTSIQYLRNNSRLDTIRVPYFKVEKFEYITDPESTLTSRQWSLLNDSNTFNPYLLGGGFAAFFPNASWGGTSLSLPNSPGVIVSEPQILGMNLGNVEVPDLCTRFLYSFTVPEDISPYPTVITNTTYYSCFIFANVTYTAGAATCENCEIVSPTVVQGDINRLKPIPDPLTVEALAIAPSVASHILSTAFQAEPLISSSSIPLQNLSIEAVSRAYQAAWSSLVFLLAGEGGGDQTSVSVAVPASEPSVLRWRVYLWASLNIAFLLAGIGFIYFQSGFRHPWVSHPLTAAFLLDTTGIFKQDDAADAMDPWHPDAKYPDGVLKLNDYDPSRPGKPRTVVLIPTQRTSHL